MAQVTSFAVLCRSGGFFVRLLASLMPTILDVLHLVTAERPHAGHHSVAAYLKRQAIYFHQKYKHSYVEDGKRCDKSRKLLEKAWDEFLYWWNDRFDITDAIFHNTLVSRKSVNDLHAIASGMAKSAAFLLFRCMPSKPEGGKWTKTAPACDFVNMVAMPNKIIMLLLEAAGQCIKTTVVNFDGNWSKLSYNESQSVRLTQSKAMVQEPKHLFHIKVGSLCFNATRCMHDAFFVASRDFQNPLHGPGFLRANSHRNQLGRISKLSNLKWAGHPSA